MRPYLVLVQGAQRPVDGELHRQRPTAHRAVRRHPPEQTEGGEGDGVAGRSVGVARTGSGEEVEDVRRFLSRLRQAVGPGQRNADEFVPRMQRRQGVGEGGVAAVVDEDDPAPGLRGGGWRLRRGRLPPARAADHQPVGGAFGSGPPGRRVRVRLPPHVRGRPGPVPGSRERIGGEGDVASGAPAVEPRPVDVFSPQIALGEPPQLLAVPVQGGRTAGQHRRRLLPDLPYRGRHQCGPHGEVRAGHRQGPGHVAEVVLLRERVGHPSHQAVQSVGRHGRHRQHHGVPTAGRPARRRGRLGQHHMGVGAAEAEAAHGPDPDAGGSRVPRHRLGGDAQRAVLEGDLRVDLLEAGGRRDDAPPQCEHDLEEARDTGGQGGVTDVGLHRSDVTRAGRGVPPAEDPDEGLRLDGIAELGPGAVRLDVAHLVRGHARARVHLLQQRGLGVRAGRGDPVGPAVPVGPRPLDHRVHGVSVGQGPLQRFEYDGPHRLAEHDPVGRGVERDAAAGGRQHAGATGPHVHPGRDHERHTAGQRHVALTRAQARHGLVHRHQGRGARRVDGDRGALEVEVVGDTGGQDRGRVAQEGLAGAVRAAALQQAEVVARARADEDTAAGPLGAGHRVPGVLQGRPRLLQEQPLLGVDQLRLHRGQVEEGGIEPVHVRKQRGPLAVRASAGPPVGVVVPRQVPAFGGHLADTAAALREVAPEGVQVRGVGEAARHADHCDVPGPGARGLPLLAHGSRLGAGGSCRDGRGLGGWAGGNRREGDRR